jgi:nucleotide-binding universal stress UspA family protein
MHSFRHILFATDFSEASRPAFEEAVALARENDAELVLAHAYEPPAFLPTDLCLTPAAYEELDAKLREDAERNLGTLKKEARRGGVRARPLALGGAPDEAIVEAAEETGADLVVIGTHGRTGAARFFLGSVASRVIASAPCPVLTVRTA